MIITSEQKMKEIDYSFIPFYPVFSFSSLLIQIFEGVNYDFLL